MGSAIKLARGTPSGYLAVVMPALRTLWVYSAWDGWSKPIHAMIRALARHPSLTGLHIDDHMRFTHWPRSLQLIPHLRHLTLPVAPDFSSQQRDIAACSSLRSVSLLWSAFEEGYDMATSWGIYRELLLHPAPSLEELTLPGGLIYGISIHHQLVPLIKAYGRLRMVHAEVEAVKGRDQEVLAMVREACKEQGLGFLGSWHATGGCWPDYKWVCRVHVPGRGQVEVRLATGH